MKHFAILLVGGLVIPVVLSACGGGGTTSQTPQKAIAVMRTTQLSTPATPIAGISATLTIPNGVTVKTTASDPYQPDATVVQLLNAGTSTTTVAPTFVFARYSAATATTAGKIKFTVMDARGFTSTEQIMINLDVTSGFFPKSSDFGLIDYVFSDINGGLLSGITPTLTATIQ